MMNRRFLGAAVAAVLVASLGALAGCASDDKEEPALTGKQVQAASVTLTLHDVNGAQVGQGSGILIAPRLVLTSAHLVAGMSRWSVTSADGTVKSNGIRGMTYDWMNYHGSQNAHPRKHDVAVIYLDKPINLDAYPKLSADKVANGTEATRLRSNGASVLQIPQKLTKVVGFPYAYLTDMPGNESVEAGGAVLNDNNEIVGVVTGRGLTTGKMYVARTNDLTDWVKPKAQCGGRKNASVRTYGTPKPKDGCDEPGGGSSSGASGNTSSGASGNTSSGASGNTSSGSSGQTSSGASGNTSGGTSGSSGQSSGSSGQSSSSGGTDNPSCNDGGGRCYGNCDGVPNGGSSSGSSGASSSGSSGTSGNTSSSGSTSSGSTSSGSTSSGGSTSGGSSGSSSGSSGSSGQSSGSSGSSGQTSGGAGIPDGSSSGSSGQSSSGSSGNSSSGSSGSSGQTSSSGSSGQTSSGASGNTSSGSSGQSTSSGGAGSDNHTDTEVCEGESDNPEICPPEADGCVGGSCGGAFAPDGLIDYGGCSGCATGETDDPVVVR